MSKRKQGTSPSRLSVARTLVFILLSPAGSNALLFLPPDPFVVRNHSLRCVLRAHPRCIVSDTHQETEPVNPIRAWGNKIDRSKLVSLSSTTRMLR